MAATVTSRDWQEVDTSQAYASSSANIQSDSLLTPLVGWAAFWTTFRVMFVEEYRENLDFAQKRRIVLFPLLLSLVTMIATIGLQFLVGEGAAQGQNAEQNFTWDQLRLFLHLPLLMFSLGMGSFAFLGRERVLSRTGAKNYLLASPALQPLNNSTAHLAYYTKDLVYYITLILSPVIFGMCVGIGLEYIGDVNTPLEWGSIPSTWLAMSTTLAQGLAMSFLASALWLRGVCGRKQLH